MTDTPTPPPPAGWYPATDGSSATWWWDGTRWALPHHEAGQQPATTNAIAKLAIATQALLIVCGVMSVTTIGIETFGISSVTGYLNGHDAAIDMMNTYDQGAFVVSMLSVLAYVVTGVLWAMWQYRAAKQVTGRTRRSAGWHAGSWFVPIVSLWFPYQNISDLWQAVGRTRPPWQITWWLLFVVSNYLVQISARIYTTAEDLEQFRVAMWMSIAGEILTLAAVPLAWLVIRGITQGVLQRSSAPEHSLVA
ncbi:DUF4328 domain-containing protein [Agromyces sp. NPDC004153]